MLQKLIPDQKRRKKFCLAWDDFMTCKIMSKSVLLKVLHVKEEGVRSELSGRGHDANQPWSTIKRGWVCVCVRAFSEGFLLHVSCVEENIWRTYGAPLLGLNFPPFFRPLFFSFTWSLHFNLSHTARCFSLSSNRIAAPMKAMDIYLIQKYSNKPSQYSKKWQMASKLINFVLCNL